MKESTYNWGAHIVELREDITMVTMVYNKPTNRTLREPYCYTGKISAEATEPLLVDDVLVIQ